MKIADRELGNDVFVIAEAGSNHNQDFDTAKELIIQAKYSGADAVKFQYYTPDSLTIKCKHPDFMIRDGLWSGDNLYSLYEKSCMPPEWLPALKRIADNIGIIFFVTVYEVSDVDELEKIGMPAYKIASFENQYLELIERAARTGKPVILSTGSSEYTEIRQAVRTIKKHQLHYGLLHCVSNYPARPEQMNLRTIPAISTMFTRFAGLSDHTTDYTSVIVAVAFGANIIEKHFMLDGMVSPDSKFSLTPERFRDMVSAIRDAEKSIGGVRWGGGHKSPYKRSIRTIEDIKQGEPLKNNIRPIRPAGGLLPEKMASVINKRAKTYIPKGEKITLDIIE